MDHHRRRPGLRGASLEDSRVPEFWESRRAAAGFLTASEWRWPPAGAEGPHSPAASSRPLLLPVVASLSHCARSFFRQLSRGAGRRRWPRSKSEDATGGEVTAPPQDGPARGPRRIRMPELLFCRATTFVPVRQKRHAAPTTCPTHRPRRKTARANGGLSRQPPRAGEGCPLVVK